MNLIRRAIKNFPTKTYVPRHLARANQRKWLRSVELLGDKWILVKQVERKQVERKEGVKA